MKPAVLILLLLCLCSYAHSQNGVVGEDDLSSTQSDIFGPSELAFAKGTFEGSNRQLTVNDSWHRVYKNDNSFFVRDYATDSNFIYQLSPGLYMYVTIPDLNHLGGIKRVHFRDGAEGLILFGDQNEYGSGGGTLSEGFMVISAGERPQMLFKMINTCGNETFARAYSESTTEASLTNYTRKVDFKSNGDIVVHPNTPELAKINKEETCEITRIASGTYRYVSGKYEKIQSPKSKIQSPKSKVQSPIR